MKLSQLTSPLSLQPQEFSRAATWLFIPTCEGNHFLEFARRHCFGTICFNVPEVFVLNYPEHPLHFNEERQIRINGIHRSLGNLVISVSPGLVGDGEDRQNNDCDWLLNENRFYTQTSDFLFILMLSWCYMCVCCTHRNKHTDTLLLKTGVFLYGFLGNFSRFRGVSAIPGQINFFSRLFCSSHLCCFFNHQYSP